MRDLFRNGVLLAVLLCLSPNAWAEGDAAAGKALFEKLCVFCHSADGEGKLGPALKGIGQRRDAAWLNHWLENPRQMVKTDEYAKSLKEHNKYNMTMPAIPAMKDDANRKNVIAFLLQNF